MMILIQNGHRCERQMRIFGRLFFSDDEYTLITTHFTHENDKISVYATVLTDDDVYFYDYALDFPNNAADASLVRKTYDAACTLAFCKAAQKMRPVSLPWGVMSGVRPAKVVRQFSESGYTDLQIRGILSKIYGASEEKIDLAFEVAKREKLLLSEIEENTVSLYIGIPFCPTRCLYCSFVSTDVRVSGKYMDEFVRLLLLEIDKTAEIMKKMNVTADNIYIGGGTPTTLSACQLTMIFDKIKERFDISALKEYTIEAGRPDTITPERLSAARKGGANRISINPQTMNDDTLRRVGRAHSSEMTRQAFYMARNAGFETINMDLIAGLPGETSKDFCHSLDEVIKLNPENITVHSLCVKRAADFRHTQNALAESGEMNKMLNYAYKIMRQTERFPYYMYRQKNMSGNLENVGYAKEGHMSVYNVNIMEEVQTIIAMGGGGSSKVVCGTHIDRVFNFKDPVEYIRRFEEILEKKNEILKLWEERNKK